MVFGIRNGLIGLAAFGMFVCVGADGELGPTSAFAQNAREAPSANDAPVVLAQAHCVDPDADRTPAQNKACLRQSGERAGVRPNSRKGPRPKKPEVNRTPVEPNPEADTQRQSRSSSGSTTSRKIERAPARTPRRDVVLTAAQRKQVVELYDWAVSGNAMIAERIEFRKNDASLLQEGRQALSRLCGVFSEIVGEGTKLTFVGHADSSGPAPYNLGLSERRAASVKFFVANTCGVPEASIDSFGAGEEIPLKKYKSNAPQQRRVEIVAQSPTS